MKTYPQMPPFTPEELEVFLHESPVARLCSHNPDGTIHIAAVYFKYDQGLFWMGTQEVSKKIRNIKRNPNVSILIDTQARPWKGVLVYGQAELVYEDAVAIRASIFERYMTPERAQEFAENLANHYIPAVIRVTPARMVSYDYSKQGFIHSVSAPAK
jgi:PPOX class probable F420-dependent enzyme